ncbi:MAG: hypothetical protein GY953_15240, partial [bacterium]|nr:hypothetical protein [bacterium]
MTAPFGRGSAPALLRVRDGMLRYRSMKMAGAVRGLLLCSVVVAGCGSQEAADAAAPEGPRTFISGSDAGYVDGAVCAGCHAEIYKTYRQTGMARAFFRPRAEKVVEDWERNNTFYHKPSDRHYTMIRRDGKFFQRRHQLDDASREINVIEKEIHFVMGSGNHARTYLHRTREGKLLELPVGWYSEKGGYWAMNPGFDRPDHSGIRRVITNQCMFCHNGYPELPEGAGAVGSDPVFAGKLPEGIDCVDLLHAAAAQGVLFTPGAAFYPNGGGRSAMRLTFNREGEARIRRGVRLLGDLIKERKRARRP